PAPQVGGRDLAGDVADDAAARVDEKGLRQPGQAVRRPHRVAVVVHDGIADPMLAQELARLPGGVADVDAHHGRLSGPLVGGRLERRRLLVARVAPGGPEVEDYRLPAQRSQSKVALTVEPAEREVRRGRDVPVVDLRRDT